MPRTRDEAAYEEMQRTIKAEARRQMAEEGTASISLRGIARVLELSAPALYRYYPTRDDIITALIVDGFNALADALEDAEQAAMAEPPQKRLMVVLQAYRSWALQNTTDFELIYGNPIPGYAAPKDVTVPTVVRTFVPIVRPLQEAITLGVLVPKPPYDEVPPSIAQHEQSLIAVGGYPVDVLAYHLSMILWSHIHGIIMLELFNHIGPNVGDVDALYQSSLHALLTSMGMHW